MADTVEQLYKDQGLQERLYPVTKESTNTHLLITDASGQAVDSGYTLNDIYARAA